MKKFKIAVCFSGQSRYWKECAENIQHYFTFNGLHPNNGDPVEVDYFIHTWDINTWRYPKQPHSNSFDEKVNNINEIAETYSAKKYIQENFIIKNHPRAWDSMFYSLHRSLFLKREYEIENNFEYDVVFKVRLDVIYNPLKPLILEFLNPKTTVIPGVCYTSSQISKFSYEYNYNCFDDVFFYGDSRTMDLVGDLSCNYKILHNESAVRELQDGIIFDPSLFYGPGTLLYDHMIRMGIHPENKQHIEYSVMRSTAKELNLNTMRDYGEIKQKNIEWYY